MFRHSRPLTQDHFAQILTEKIRTKKTSDIGFHFRDESFNFSKWMRKHGFGLELNGIDFTQLPEDVQQWLSINTTYSNMVLTNCTLMAGKYENCVMVNCKFISKSTYKNCLVQAGDTLKVFNQENLVNADLDTTTSHPLVAVLRSPEQGTSHTDKMIQLLKDRDINVLTIFNDIPAYNGNPLDQFVKDHPELFDGFLLPGGSNVTRDTLEQTAREHSETLLMDLSMEHKIPLLGVCRGHQFVGHYFGASVKSVDHHKGGQIFLTSDNKSKLLATVEQVYQESSANPQAENSTLRSRYYESPQAVRKLNNVYCYKSSCLHSQGLFFKGPIDPRVKITARSAEGLPESLQIEDHILTFQHHHESNQNSKIGVASLNIFFDMIKEFHQKKIEQRNAEQAERNEYHKREAHPDDDAAVVSGKKIAKTDRDATSSSSFTI